MDLVYVFSHTLMHARRSSLLMPGFKSTVNPAFVSLSGQQLSIGSLMSTRLPPKAISTKLEISPLKINCTWVSV